MINCKLTIATVGVLLLLCLYIDCGDSLPNKGTSSAQSPTRRRRRRRVVKAQPASQPSVFDLDLSNVPHVPAKNTLHLIQEALELQIWDYDNAKDKRDTPVDYVKINLDGSYIGDAGAKRLASLLRNCTSNINLHVSAKRNILTTLGATALVHALTPTNDTHVQLQSLDLSLNDFAPDQQGIGNFCKALKNFVTENRRLTELTLESCAISPIICRALARGLTLRFTDNQALQQQQPISLSLCGNTMVGDSGLAALAGAVHSMSKTNCSTVTTFMRKLDVSSCNIGNSGIQALSHALTVVPKQSISCIDLSNNNIGPVGAKVLGQALLDNKQLVLDSLYLDNNPDISDKGAAALFSTLLTRVNKLSLRSCQVYADGTAALGLALQQYARNKHQSHNVDLHIDLSGNPIGILRGKAKKSGNKYSASLIRSKASATAASYLNMFSKNIKDVVGIDLNPNSGESDDEEDSGMGKELASSARCGAKALVDAFIGEDDVEYKAASLSTSPSCTIHLDMRRCFLDFGAADALAALKVTALTKYGITIKLNVDMNTVLEEETVAALHDEPDTENLLQEMSERHLDALEALREAKQKALEAAKAARARIQAEAKLQSSYRSRMRDQYADDVEEDEDELWDSDAEYDNTGEDMGI